MYAHVSAHRQRKDALQVRMGACAVEGSLENVETLARFDPTKAQHQLVDVGEKKHRRSCHPVAEHLAPNASGLRHGAAAPIRARHETSLSRCQRHVMLDAVQKQWSSKAQWYRRVADNFFAASTKHQFVVKVTPRDVVKAAGIGQSAGQGTSTQRYGSRTVLHAVLKFARLHLAARDSLKQLFIARILCERIVLL